MERREIEGALLVTAVSGGVAAMIGVTALPAGSPYFNPLIIGGVSAILIGLTRLLVLWRTAPKRTPSRSGSHPAIRIGTIEASVISDVQTDAEQILDIETAKGLTLKRVSQRWRKR